MNRDSIYDKPEQYHLPHVGQRITKTTVAVFLCLIIYYLRGYQGESMPTEAMITAIICMQPYVRDSRDYALNRLAGTLIGAGWGLLFLLLLLVFPSMGSNMPLLYARMALGVLVSLYTAVAVRKPDTASLAAIVFLCVVISFPDIEDPLRQASLRIFDVFIGTLVAIGVNVFRLPREKKRDQVFFVRTKDLVPDRFTPLPAAAMFRLNYLYDDGARICLMTEHAPAFFMLQMNATKLNTPLIVMDGAAIYDADRNVFLKAETLNPEDTDRILARLRQLNIGCFIYTVHADKTCIFHVGEIRDPEKTVYERMKRSPYRDYLDGEIFEPEEVVYIKVIDTDVSIRETEYHLRGSIPKGRLRSVIRPQAGAPGISGLYIYAHTATMEQAEKRLMQMLKEENEALVPVDIRLRTPYRTETDAMQLLHTIGNCYEPVRLLPRRRQHRKSAE
ncbi:MAG: FUSC family protein [Oscillospiraceae bacterium]|nr:FUSC family protein [Oscillospiraceae bacterium]MBR2800920.1 FUSC family protein [Oscillospiraceae bacterium]